MGSARPSWSWHRRRHRHRDVERHPAPGRSPQDLRHIEVGRYLRAGANTLTVRVASTLINAVRVAPGTGRRTDRGWTMGCSARSPDPGDARQPTLSGRGARSGIAAGRRRHQRGARPDHQRVTRARVGDGRGDDRRRGRGDPVETGRTDSGPVVEATELGARLSGRLDSGSSELTIDAVAANGSTGQTYVTLRHSDDLALNATGSPYPRAWASSYQYKNPPSFLTDGSAATHWVSNGQTPGQAPTPESPELIGVDLGRAVDGGRGRPGRPGQLGAAVVSGADVAGRQAVDDRAIRHRRGTGDHVLHPDGGALRTAGDHRGLGPDLAGPQHPAGRIRRLPRPEGDDETRPTATHHVS